MGRWFLVGAFASHPSEKPSSPGTHPAEVGTATLHKHVPAPPPPPLPKEHLSTNPDLKSFAPPHRSSSSGAWGMGHGAGLGFHPKFG
jgi:hypothetical protein